MNTFNKKANPITVFFLETVDELLEHDFAIGEQIADIEKFFSEPLEDENQSEKYQYFLQDIYHDLLNSLDNHLNCLNYFKYLGFERTRLLQQNKLNLNNNHPTIKALATDEDIDKEINDAITDVFDTLYQIRDRMDEATKETMLNPSRTADICEEEVPTGRFTEPNDMNDRMEYNFWLHFSRRLHFYPTSEAMTEYLDRQQNDTDERITFIKMVLAGREAEMFPAPMCKLDQFTEEEIDMAKHVLEREKDEEDIINSGLDSIAEEYERPAAIQDNQDGAKIIPFRPKDPNKPRP